MSDQPPAEVDRGSRPSGAALLRLAIAVLLALLVAFVGALVLGEYEFSGSLPYVAGPLFGLIVAEVLVSVGDQRSRVVGVVGALLSAGALWLAGWFDSSNGVEPVKAAVYPAMALGALAAGFRCGLFARGSAAGGQESSER